MLYRDTPVARYLAMMNRPAGWPKRLNRVVCYEDACSLEEKVNGQWVVRTWEQGEAPSCLIEHFTGLQKDTPADPLREALIEASKAKQAIKLQVYDGETWSLYDSEGNRMMPPFRPVSALTADEIREAIKPKPTTAQLARQAYERLAADYGVDDEKVLALLPAVECLERREQTCNQQLMEG